MADAVKISYAAASWRVKCELTREACLESEVPPSDLIERARSKLESIKAAGDIAFYVVYETRLHDAWTALRAANDEPLDRKVMFTLGAGAPLLSGIRIDDASQAKSIAALTVEAPVEVVAHWRYETFKLMVSKRLRDHGIKEPPNNAQLFAAFVRARQGEKIHQMPLGSGSPSAFPTTNKTFSVVANKARMEIGVVIRSVKELRAQSVRESLLTLVGQAMKQMSTDSIDYRMLKRDFLTAIQGAVDGLEGLGLELPLVLLAATGHVRATVPANYPGAGRLQLKISPDKMEAKIAAFDTRLYDDTSFSVDVAWVQLELKRNRISIPMSEDLSQKLNDAIIARENLDGLVVAKGQPSVGRRGPELRAVYRDAAGRGTLNLDQDNLNMREMQQRVTVKAGQIVAQIQYGSPGSIGHNIYGEELPAAADEELPVRIGEGIQQREAGHFYATVDGIPVIENGEISLNKVLKHKGDVNLRTGNIHFDGPVEILGSIDTGAWVEVTGDLIVHGSIQGAQVRCGGNLEVKRGITTSSEGRVQVRGNVTAEFIENSHIVCGGNLVVSKVVVNSDIVVGGDLRVVSDSGMMGGGHIICRGSLYTPALGFQRGALTNLNVGVDWRWAHAVQVRQTRLEKLQKVAHDDRQSLRELAQRSKAQMTQRHTEMKEELQDRLQRLRVLLEKAEQHLQKAESLITYDSNVRICVQNLLASNVSIKIAGQAVPITTDLAGVAVLGKRRRGNFIVAIEEAEAEEQKSAS